ncbi:26S proteasome non-ATPase regulatory subunit 3-like [Xenia sp. Carnegie-2017]|uniref:26S proteasome non-ATPase regulatory subunit 3-like n=1 Tax=Xenia sp. Carnegie-2017 TaxID=2897299 RepID=UPI001F04ED67|nr:26S proteasome non-ATPase regulatory subunit 3-like [Xenia sp. Carnegie-2017]
MSVDQEMKDAQNGLDEKKERSKEELSKAELEKLALEDFKEHVKHVEKGVNNKEPHFILRVLRSLASARKKLNHFLLRKLISGYFIQASHAKNELLKFLDEPMETNLSVPYRPRTGKAALMPVLPEVEFYFHLLVVIHLIDTKSYEQALKCSTLLLKKSELHNRRTLDLILAKCYFYHSRAYELLDRFDDVRSFFHHKLRTATLRHNIEGQATILNLLLRNYLHYNLYDQADKLVSKSSFPDTASNSEWARYLYYTGIIKAKQLDYSEAHKNLIQAIRKAPQFSAVGFRQIAQKFAIVVELLLGEIPDRATFRDHALKKTLFPYFRLTKAVLAGDLGQFNDVIVNYKEKFIAEKTYTLIIRLHHNVIKTGIRMISLSYSKISLEDIAAKLQLDSPEDAEFIVAKAIRDGVIEATIDHEQGFVQSKEIIDLYSTNEPQAAFHQRIAFCLDIYNQSVKAMRFPPKSYNKDLESLEEQREREKQDLELAKEMADDDEDSFP